MGGKEDSDPLILSCELMVLSLIRPSGTFSRWEKGKSNQMRLNTSVPLVPPKPKPFDIATSIFFSRATFGT